MDARGFVAIVKKHVVEGTIEDTMSALVATPVEPTSPNPEDSPVMRSFAEFVHRAKLRRFREAVWFQGLLEEDRERITALLCECAERTASSFFAVLDGVGGQAPGVFEIVEVNGRKRRVLNPESSEMLHDLFSELCEATRTLP